MADVHSSEKRSFNMSRIRSKNSKPELIVRKFLFSNGFRYRVNVAKLPGKPDIVLKKYHTIIFVNGCFWHGHKNCKYFKLPSTKTEWWAKKIQKNIVNDDNNIMKLEAMNWNVLVVWECELKSVKRSSTLNNIAETLRVSR